MRRCNTCKGEYEPAQPGGYYHACPPEIDPITLAPRPRKDARDENIDDSDPEHPKIKSEGKGFVEVTI